MINGWCFSIRSGQVSRVVSSSSDWKCRSLLHPEGSTVLVMAGLNPMQDYCAKYNSGRDMYRYQDFRVNINHARCTSMYNNWYAQEEMQRAMGRGSADKTVSVSDRTPGSTWIG